MTGRGQHGGSPGRDHWRGGRDDLPAASEPSRGTPSPSARDGRRGDPFRTGVEVEDLATQALASRPQARIPLSGLIAVAGIAALLAGGFGFLGGGPGGGPGVSPPFGSPVAGSTSEPMESDSPMPRVTPWSTCAGTPDAPPQPVLEVDGRQHFAEVEILELDVELEPAIGGIPAARGGRLDDVVEVPMDAVTDIWLVGGVCAVAWNIALVGPAAPEAQVLESVPNRDRDPALSAQNRFEVFVAPYAGDHLLRAVLILEHVAVRATWAIHVPPLAQPVVSLESETRTITTAIGCDVTQRLVNDWEERLSPCSRDVGREPAPRADVRWGETIEFSIQDWGAGARNTTVVCGELSDRSFVPMAEGECIGGLDPLFAGARFSLIGREGPVTLAISTCATRIRVSGSGFEELCGTWYANVRVGGTDPR